MAAELYLKLIQVGSKADQSSKRGRISASEIQATKLLVAGDALGENFERQIELTDLSWSLKLEENSQSKISPGPSVIRLTKPVDTASGKLMAALNSDTCFPGAVISLIDRTDLGMCVFMTLQNVRFVSHSVSVKSARKTIDLTETWTLRYTNISIGRTGKYSKAASIPPDFDVEMNERSAGELNSKPVVKELLEFTEQISKDKSFASDLKGLQDRASELFKKSKLG